MPVLADKNNKEGWARPHNSRRRHYMIGDVSLCKQAVSSEYELDDQHHPTVYSCRNCSKILRKRESQEKANG